MIIQKLISILGLIMFNISCVIVNDNSNFIIQQCQMVSKDTCETDLDFSARSTGVLDITLANSYSCPLLVNNQLVSKSDSNSLKIETSIIQIYNVDVNIDNQIFSNKVNGIVDPSFVDPKSGLQRSGFGLIKIDIIPSSFISKFNFESDKDVTSKVILHGRTLGGDELVTPEWDFTVHICKGCLCDRNTCDLSGEPEANCHVGIDDLVDCRFNVPGCIL